MGIDLAEANADGTHEVPMPTVAVVDTAGVIRWIDVHPNYTTRTEVADIVHAFSAHWTDYVSRVGVPTSSGPTAGRRPGFQWQRGRASGGSGGATTIERCTLIGLIAAGA